MTQRFQIEDIVAQDPLGVVFRALDTETNAVVAVRRFFPFGADGGGLSQEEVISYNIAVSRLAELSHPNMRAVVFGGCDPIDGMPFIATEWIEGKSLDSFLKGKPLSTPHAISLIKSALEICELISNLLAEEGVWVDTDTQTIIVGTAESSRGVTFWISPSKWLAHDNEPHHFDSFITFTEEIMGWKGKVVKDQAARGLGGWLNWLRGSSKTASLREAREMLTSSTEMEPLTPRKNLVRPAAARPAVPIQSARMPRRKSISGTVVVIVLLSLIAVGLGTWAIYRKDPNEPKLHSGLPELAAEVSKESARKNPRASNTSSPNDLSPELREVAAAMNENTAKPPKPEEPSPPAHTRAKPRKEKKPEPVAETAPTPNKDPGIFSPDDTQITQQEGREVIVEGVFEKMDHSKSGKTLYVLFSKRPSKNATRGAIFVSGIGAGLSEDALTPLIGKKIRIRGVLNVQKDFGLQRPDVTLKDRTDIEVIP